MDQPKDRAGKEQKETKESQETTQETVGKSAVNSKEPSREEKIKSKVQNGVDAGVDVEKRKVVLDKLREQGRKYGFGEQSERLKAYIRILFKVADEDINNIESKREEYLKAYSDNNSEVLDKVKEASTVVKDALRSQHAYFKEEELKQKQDELARLLKAYFLAYPDSAYYQGLNSVMSVLQREYSDPGQIMLIFEGILKDHLWDFANLEFDKCLIPVFHLIALVFCKLRGIEDKAPIVELVQSRLKIITSWSLSLDNHLVQPLGRRWPTR